MNTKYTKNLKVNFLKTMGSSDTLVMYMPLQYAFSEKERELFLIFKIVHSVIQHK